MKRMHVLTRAAIPSALLLVGIGLAPTPVQALGAVAPPVTEVTIDDAHVITMNTTLTPGLNTFHITSTKLAGFQLVVLKPGYTHAEVASDVNAAFNDDNMAALRRFQKKTTLLGGVSTHPGGDGTMSLDLPADTVGQIAAVDTAPRRMRPNKIVDLTLSGTAVTGTLPYDATLRTKGDTTWARHPASIPSSGTLRFVNGATQNHFIAMMKLKKGKTYHDWKVFVRKVVNGKNPRPPVKFNVGMDSGALSPSHEFTFEYAVPRGDYVLTCFWPDASMGGIPHAFMGMGRLVHVVAPA